MALDWIMSIWIGEYWFALVNTGKEWLNLGKNWLILVKHWLEISIKHRFYLTYKDNIN